VMYIRRLRKDRERRDSKQKFRRRIIELDLATLHRDASHALHAPLLTTSGAHAVLFTMEL
jgi:hypothetical protein